MCNSQFWSSSTGQITLGGIQKGSRNFLTSLFHTRLLFWFKNQKKNRDSDTATDNNDPHTNKTFRWNIKRSIIWSNLVRSKYFECLTVLAKTRSLGETTLLYPLIYSCPCIYHQSLVNFDQLRWRIFNSKTKKCTNLFAPKLYSSLPCVFNYSL